MPTSQQLNHFEFEFEVTVNDELTSIKPLDKLLDNIAGRVGFEYDNVTINGHNAGFLAKTDFGGFDVHAGAASYMGEFRGQNT